MHDDETIVISNKKSKKSQFAFNIGDINIKKHHGIADAGATGHFLLPQAPVKNICPTTAPLEIALPDGKTIKSTHTCDLDIPSLPPKARRAHIVPGLKHASLISIKMLCDAGCHVEYNANKCDVIFENKKVWVGERDKSTGLWVLPLKTSLPSSKNCSPENLQNFAATTRHITKKQDLIIFLHQCLFCPPKHTLLRAIKNNQLPTWPGLTYDAVTKYLPDSCPATDKGHMRRQRQGIQSTKNNVHEENITVPSPPIENNMANLFFETMIVENKHGKIYVDLTGNFPLRSIDGKRAIFIIYDWSSNAILATPISSTSDNSTLIRSPKT
ncbi:MAG: hypothetical protein GY748_18945 [Planctomycetaceae bacterium]|nr:hypothetical protein [Planctomycetaceae bacterium]